VTGLNNPQAAMLDMDNNSNVSFDPICIVPNGAQRRADALAEELPAKQNWRLPQSLFRTFEDRAARQQGDSI